MTSSNTHHLADTKKIGIHMKFWFLAHVWKLWHTYEIIQHALCSSCKKKKKSRTHPRVRIWSDPTYITSHTQVHMKSYSTHTHERVLLEHTYEMIQHTSTRTHTHAHEIIWHTHTWTRPQRAHIWNDPTRINSHTHTHTHMKWYSTHTVLFEHTYEMIQHASSIAHTLHRVPSESRMGAYNGGIRLIHMCDMTQSRKWVPSIGVHDSFIHVTWFRVTNGCLQLGWTTPVCV